MQSGRAAVRTQKRRIDQTCSPNTTEKHMQQDERVGRGRRLLPNLPRKAKGGCAPDPRVRRRRRDYQKLLDQVYGRRRKRPQQQENRSVLRSRRVPQKLHGGLEETKRARLLPLVQKADHQLVRADARLNHIFCQVHID